MKPSHQKAGVTPSRFPDGTKVEELNKSDRSDDGPVRQHQILWQLRGNMTEVSYQVAKRAAKKGAKYYHITRQWQERGNNLTVSADLYK